MGHAAGGLSWPCCLCAKRAERPLLLCNVPPTNFIV